MVKACGVQSLCGVGGGMFDLGLGGWKGFPEVEEERIRPLLEGERPAVSAGDCSPTLVAVLVITAIITTLGCMQGTRAEKVGLGVRWSWAHTSALPP